VAKSAAVSENLLSRLEQSLRQSRAARMHLAARLRELVPDTLSKLPRDRFDGQALRYRRTDQRFDRVVSVEMFEHMSNWEALLARIKGWLKPEGYLFIHIFTHDKASYRFDHADKADWIAQHFFTGGNTRTRDHRGTFQSALEKGVHGPALWRTDANSWSINSVDGGNCRASGNEIAVLDDEQRFSEVQDNLALRGWPKKGQIPLAFFEAVHDGSWRRVHYRLE